MASPGRAESRSPSCAVVWPVFFFFPGQNKDKCQRKRAADWMELSLLNEDGKMHLDTVHAAAVTCWFCCIQNNIL